MRKNFTTAFRDLGYEVASPRQDWSAEKDDGVCITLWQSEMGFDQGAPFFDTQLHAMPIELWGHKPGNAKRIRHLRQAIERHHGYVDVVIVRGVPGSGVQDAEGWDSKRRGGRWRVAALDEATGHMRVYVERSASTES